MTKNDKSPSCDPNDLALKSFFLGPQAENEAIVEQTLHSIIQSWLNWRKSSFSADGPGVSPDDQVTPEFVARSEQLLKSIEKISNEFRHEIPKFSPRYIGHMFSETSIPGLMGNFLALLYNPNNISMESSTSGIDLERAAIGALCEMIGYNPKSRGHFTSGGTIANFEMLFRAKQLWKLNLAKKTWPNEMAHDRWLTLSDFDFLREVATFSKTEPHLPVLLLPASAHYSWDKGMNFLGLGSAQMHRLSLNQFGQIDTKKLRSALADCMSADIPILGLVSILGTTEFGSFDPINDIVEILQDFSASTGQSVWHHVDAAYGGFFATVKGIPEIATQHPKLLSALKALPSTTSITIDPHKLGYVPYSSGCFICQDPERYTAVSTVAPYIDFRTVVDPGPFTIEGSRSAAGAVATLLSAEAIGFDHDGLGKIIFRAIGAATKLREHLNKMDQIVLEPDYEHTNILCFAIRGHTASLKSVNASTAQLHSCLDRFNRENPKDAFYISKTKILDSQAAVIESFCSKYRLTKDDNQLYLIRCTVMNPFLSTKHSSIDYIEHFCERVQRFANKSHEFKRGEDGRQ